MTTTPIVTLQKPKDISLSEIEAELNKIWLSQNTGKATPVATRAATFSMVVYEPEEYQQLLAALGFYEGAIDGINGPKTKEAIGKAQASYGLRITSRVDSQTLERLRGDYEKRSPEEKAPLSNPDFRGSSISEAIANQNPCRIITLCPVLGEDKGVSAQVSAYCPIRKSNSGGTLVCCEYITLRGTKEALERVKDLIASLLIPDLPKFFWWKATPNPEQPLFRELAQQANCIVVDSCYFSDPAAELLKINELIESETYIADLNWHRFYPWQELTAAAFDPPERRQSLVDIDRVTIDYEKGNDAQALMFLGWLASRLDWKPISYTEEGGDYDIKRVELTGTDDKTIHVELAGIPTADWGEIPGDLVGVLLNSSYPGANCCTILCSETTGCMRMEAGGSAQSCRTEQVTAVTDQKAEAMMSQQLQRWGRDVLYEESLSVSAEIIKLRQF
ncbi:glucose-6-phosphate dehydrogenase assembly protein OpcA [Roseofilum casamattae]|uniref:Glucose-6-phosphate dehydrogenase assembly protein OpcA n=1 Tax=Roseofilum casamattae BLCC-M143 TaxID=3022442 RepID=A0ABT7BSL9_9CYAN|nr:glucose-6-phosphate dehydrogenase assembly protein OpcA [Roseofilum casamattae]MDJ1182191.1 glucose-6-phosphate dehydrogenase assembly protein OpcA [Roseofilum casamattae BLCC-M143]